MKFPLGAMNVGDVLDRSIRLLIGRLPLLLGVNVLFLSPLFAFQLLIPFTVPRHQMQPDEYLLHLLLDTYGGPLIQALLMPFAAAATLTVTINEYLGRPTSLGAAVGLVFSRFFSLLGASMLVGLICTFAMMMCCIPYFYFWVSYLFVGQVIVAEGSRAMASLSRSSQLADGFRWRLFGTMLLVSVICGVLAMLVVLPTGIFFPPYETIVGERSITFLFSLTNYMINHIIAIPMTLLVGVYTAVTTTLLYLDLRIRKEGLDLQVAVEDAAGDQPR